MKSGNASRDPPDTTSDFRSDPGETRPFFDTSLGVNGVPKSTIVQAPVETTPMETDIRADAYSHSIVPGGLLVMS